MIEVLVPWRGGCSHRETALKFCRQTYPYSVRLALGGEPWIKGAAIWAALDAAPEIVVLADADVWCDGDLEAAVAAVASGEHEWAIPHGGVHRLSECGTQAVLAGEPWRDQELSERAYRGIQGGGIVVTRRETLRAVPFDPRFVGWGQEDASWAAAMNTVVGAPWRGQAALVHLWHPPQPRLTRKWGSVEGKALHRRYLAAMGDEEAMTQLLEEARDALDAHKPPLHDRSALGIG